MTPRTRPDIAIGDVIDAEDALVRWKADTGLEVTLFAGERGFEVGIYLCVGGTDDFRYRWPMISDARDG